MSDDHTTIYRHTDGDGDRIEIRSWPYAPSEGESETQALMVHGYGLGSHATSVRLFPGEVRRVVERLTTWLEQGQSPTPTPRSEWSDLARRREALRAAVSVWTAVDNADPVLDSEDVLAWAQDFEHYLKTGETRVRPVPEPEPTAHVPLPFTAPTPKPRTGLAVCPDCDHDEHRGTICAVPVNALTDGTEPCGCGTIH